MLNREAYKKLSFTGFTLLEVMAALAILAIALVAIFNAESQSMKLSEKAGYITTAVNLAKARLGELELDILEKGFDSVKEKESGKFEDDRFEGYRWEYTSNKIVIPLVSIDPNAKSVTENPFLKMAQDMLEKSIKEVRLKVFFKDGKKEDFVEIVTHFSNPKDLPIVQAAPSSENK